MSASIAFARYVHASYGKSVGKHFPLWVSLYTALAATATFFLLLGMKRWDVSLGPLQKTFQPLQDRLGSTGCLVSSLAGCALGGTTLFLASLPAWGEGHENFRHKFLGSWHFKQPTPTFVGYFYSKHVSLFRSLPVTQNACLSVAARFAFAVEGIAFFILSLLDLTIGILSLPCTLVTLGKHKGSRNTTLSCLGGSGWGIWISARMLTRVFLPSTRYIHWQRFE